MQLIGCIFRSEKFFNILEFIYYVSFYSHVCTNYFWFVPSLTLFRTYLVQVYNIMRNVTTFLKVIFVHFSKDNETVSFIKLLDFGLSQGRVSAVSIKCVVICSKFITFAVTKTTVVTLWRTHIVLWFAQNSLPLRWQRQWSFLKTLGLIGCDLLKIHYICGDKDNRDNNYTSTVLVVICSKFITFAVTKTIQDAT